MAPVPSFEFGPRERARLEGVHALGDADLIAILLGTGMRGRPVSVVAAELLAEAGGLVGLAREGVPPPSPASQGIGDAKRARLEAAIELGRRAARLGAMRDAAKIAGPIEVAAWARAEIGHAPHEELWVLAMDAKNGLVAARRVGQGGTYGCTTSIRDILRVALRAGATAMVLVHNHPSGDPAPSVEDARLTVEVARASYVIGAPLLDHVIVAGDRHSSLFAMGLVERPPPLERSG